MGTSRNRVLAAGIGLVAAAAVLVGCSDDKGTTPAASSSPAASGGGTSQVSTGGNTEVKVEGQDLAGLDLSTVTCVKQAGKINVASGSATGGLGVVMTDEATPKVESLGLTVDGNALAVVVDGWHEHRIRRRQGRRKHLHHHR